MKLEKFTLGVGDRFAHQAKAQLQACIAAKQAGLTVAPVWNKSNREHNIVHSEPSGVRAAADAAVRALDWHGAYYVDADHINLGTVDRFLAPSDFFTLDVAESIGRDAGAGAADEFLGRHPEIAGTHRIPGIDEPLEITPELARSVAAKYLFAVQEAGRIYRYIADRKDAESFVTEVSMDETDSPQTPPELLIILAAISDEKIPIQTIAPKFTGRFNKGVDYAGDALRFEREFSDDLAVIAHSIRAYGLPGNLKLSVHSGSDKFSIYGAIRRSIARTGAGVHIKTAGTTWLEELIGLAEAGGDGLALAKEIYAGAYAHFEALCAPYASVIDIDKARLPAPDAVAAWSSGDYTSALRHDQTNPAYNPNLRQLLHVGYKIAANMGERYTRLLVECESAVSRNVTENLYVRHITPLFLS